MDEEELKNIIYEQIVDEIKERMGDVEVSREGDDIIVKDKNKKVRRQYSKVLEKVESNQDMFFSL